MVEDFLSTIGQSPVLLIVAAFLLALLGYALVKRLLKMALFLAVFVAIYIGLLWVMGYPMPF